MKSEELDKAILDLLGKDSSPPDNKMHALAERKGIEPDQLEEEVYKLLGDIGKHKDSPDSDFDKGQLAAGVKVEKEHTDNPLIARNISKDHLAEIPDYYARLKAMEDSAKKTAMLHNCRDELNRIQKSK